MSQFVTPILIALKTITLLLGGLITYFSWKAHRRSGSKSLAVGFAIVTAGILLAGVLDQLLRLSLIPGSPMAAAVDARAVADVALVIESGLTALGFGVIVYSLYSE
jgi:uncharacterized membrane protein